MYKQIIKDLEYLMDNYPKDGLESGLVHIINKYQKIDDQLPFTINVSGKNITCKDYWDSKRYSVIYVEKEEHIKILYDTLVEQDNYWKVFYMDFIKVREESDNSIPVTSYAGKLDIYNVKELRLEMLSKGVKFLIYQELEDNY